MRIDPLDFSQARMAPEYVMRGLEELDPTACIVHLGGVRWLVGKIRPSSLVRADACEMFDHWTRAVQGSGRRLSPSGRMRVRFAQLALLGVRPVELYTILWGEPDGRIVADFERSRWLWLHTSDNEMQQDLDDSGTVERDASRRALSNPDLAKDAWRYAFTQSHLVGGSLAPVDRPRSGWVRHSLTHTLS